jgi:type IV pilus assembly protein PilV
MTARHPRPQRRNGFTLIEVLIALLVMSIGLLGIGKIMMLSARANDSALMRSQATALGYTILDAMRANRQAALSGAYITALGVVPGAVACTAAAPCSSGQQAQNDLNLWGASLTAGLPTGQGSVATANVVTPAGTEVTATVTVQWTDTVAQQTFGGPAAGNLVSIVLETVL